MGEKFIRGSEVQDFLRCRLRWKYRWIDGLKAKKPNNKLFFGTLFHKFREVLYDTGQEDIALLEMDRLYYDTDTSSMDQVELDELYALSVGVARNYYTKWWEDDSTKINTIATELTFAVPLADGFYTGTIDHIFTDLSTGKMAFSDCKTTSSIERFEKNLEMDRQVSRYWWALSQLASGFGYILEDDVWIPVTTSSMYGHLTEPSYFMYDLVLRDVPMKPKPLKNGGLSKNKTQKTTYALYIQALKEMYADMPKDQFQSEILPQYDDILTHLYNNSGTFLKRITAIRNDLEIQNAVEELSKQLNEVWRIKALNEDTQNQYIYRNITHDCTWDCEYKSLCMASMDGSNVDMIINLGYEKEEIQHGKAFRN